MVAFHIAGAPEPMAGIALLHGGDHGIDAVASIALQHRVDVGGTLGPCCRDQVTASACVGLVPSCDVAVDQVGQGIHPSSPSLPHHVRCGATDALVFGVGR